MSIDWTIAAMECQISQAILNFGLFDGSMILVGYKTSYEFRRIWIFGPVKTNILSLKNTVWKLQIYRLTWWTFDPFVFAPFCPPFALFCQEIEMPVMSRNYLQNSLDIFQEKTRVFFSRNKSAVVTRFVYARKLPKYFTKSQTYPRKITYFKLLTYIFV